MLHYDFFIVAGEDYIPVENEPLTFNSVVSRLCVTVSSIQDSIAETEENFILTLSSNESSVLLLPAEANINIADDERKSQLTYFALC